MIKLPDLNTLHGFDPCALNESFNRDLLKILVENEFKHYVTSEESFKNWLEERINANETEKYWTIIRSILVKDWYEYSDYFDRRMKLKAF